MTSPAYARPPRRRSWPWPSSHTTLRPPSR